MDCSKAEFSGNKQRTALAASDVEKIATLWVRNCGEYSTNNAGLSCAVVGRGVLGTFRLQRQSRHHAAGAHAMRTVVRVFATPTSIGRHALINGNKSRAQQRGLRHEPDD